MTAAPAIDVRRSTKNRQAGRGTDPPWAAVELPCIAYGNRIQLKNILHPGGEQSAEPSTAATTPAVERQRAQLPSFAPLLEELEVAGWSSQRRPLCANFHDWILLRGNRLLVLAGHSAIAESADPIDAALVSQAAWAAIRAHAAHATDAGDVLSLASRTLWAAPAAALASLAVALVDVNGGSISVALSGDCLAWRVRAATCERLSIYQPPVGTTTGFSYQSQTFRLALRERLILVADDALVHSSKAELALTARFSHLNAEAHRRMAATDAVALARQVYEGCDVGPNQSVSIAAIRRR